MGLKTRYLQLSDTIMMEYNFHSDAYNNISASEYGYLRDGLVLTKLKDGRFCVFSPLSSEVSKEDYKKLPLDEIVTINNINHLAVPMDRKDSAWHAFLDPDYEFCNAGNIGCDIVSDDPKASSYIQYCEAPDASTSDIFKVVSFGERELPCDNVKLYFVNGYDFSNIYGIIGRLSVNRHDGNILDLCNLFLNRSTIYQLVKYMSSPIIFGNAIYDRYIEINLPSLYSITCDENFLDLNNILDIVDGSNINLSFSYIEEGDYELKDYKYEIPDAISATMKDLRICEFTRSSNVKGTIPSEAIVSDNLGVYIAESPEYPYIEFYGTWKGSPLSYKIVQDFNRGAIRLYDSAIVRKRLNDYEVTEDYSPDINLRKWVVMHEIVCRFMKDDTILKEETYNMSQVFVKPNDEITKFYYRPVIFDEALADEVNNIHVNYVMRFINIEDCVQFIKTCSLGIADNIQRYYAKGSRIPSGSLINYTVYNKIVEQRQEYMNSAIVSPKTKYVKVFYNSADIYLDENGTARYGGFEYDLKLSNVPKNYKFVFRKAKEDGKYDYMDLTDGYYKLFTKDSGGNDIVIEPTYTPNMNLLFGELEFNISSNVLSRLMEVDESERKMSIVAISDNNFMSSMYDFTYSF